MGSHIIFLFGIKNRPTANAWSCAKVKRAVKSTVDAEMLGIEHAMYLKENISKLYLARELC